MSLSFAALRKANTIRLPLFTNGRGEAAHSKLDGSDWSHGEWMNAILGELGEAANIVKKIKRGDFTLEEMALPLAQELADVVTYTDLAAMQFGINFDNYTFDQFRSVNLSVFNSFENYSLGEWMNKAFGSFGSIARIVDEAKETPQNYSEKLFEVAIRKNLIRSLMAIDCAAIKCGFDLGQAVTWKFNQVSTRVKADVFIVGGEITNGQGEVL